MDPDASLRDALSLPDEDGRREAARALHRWLSHGGYPPSEKVIRDLGINRRIALFRDRTMYLERYRDGWAIGYRPYDCTPTYVKLRREAKGA